MLRTSNHNAAAAPSQAYHCVGRLFVNNNASTTTIASSGADEHASTSVMPWLWPAVDLCDIDRGSGSYTGCSSPAADITVISPMVLDINFYVCALGPTQARTNTPIIRYLTAQYPKLLWRLEVLRITWNDHDDSSDLGAFAALAPHVRELTFRLCGLSSMRGLEGHCVRHLRKVDLGYCQQLNSLEGLQGHERLEEVDVSNTAISDVRPLREGCPALTRVDLSSCQHIHSLDGLQGHAHLKEVKAPYSALTSIRELQDGCPALTSVDFSHCQQLNSLEGLQGHARLQEVRVRGTAITSVRALQEGCHALKLVDLQDCKDLPDEVKLPVKGVTILRRWLRSKADPPRKATARFGTKKK